MAKLKWIKRRRGYSAPTHSFTHFLKSRLFRVITLLVVVTTTIGVISSFTSKPTPPAEAATQIVAERFTGPNNGVTQAQNANWSLGGSYTPVMVDGPDIGTDVDRLRLTPTSPQGLNGYALYDVGQTTNSGLDITFNLSINGYGGTGCPTNPSDNYNATSSGGLQLNSGNSCQADGFAFYLKRGTNTDTGSASLGQVGGSLGYSATSSNSGSGLSGALLGIGFDAYGNFYQQPFGGTGCSGDPNNSSTILARRSLILRGEQGASRTAGYCRISSENDRTQSSRNIGVDISNTTIFSTGGAAIRILIDPTDDDGGTKPRGTGRIYISSAGTTSWSGISQITEFQLPQALIDSDTFKFGYVAGTGGGTMNTEIWSASVSSIRDIQDPQWVTGSSQCAVRNASSSLTLSMAEGVAPYTYSLTSGSLPAGLSLSNGVISGTPTTVGVSTFTIQASDGRATPVNVSQTFTYAVRASSCAITNVTSCTGAGFLQNGSFESLTGGNPDSWRTTATDGAFEVWGPLASGAQPTSTATIGAPSDAYSFHGSYISELQANNTGGPNQGLYQDISTIPGSIIRWSYRHHHRVGVSDADQVSKVVIGSRPSNVPAGSTWTLTEQGNPFSGGTVTETSHTASRNGGWGLSSGSYTVPTGQTTTRFLFQSVTSPSNGYGNLLDDITFTPTLACPQSITLVAGRARALTMVNNSQNSSSFQYYSPGPNAGTSATIGVTTVPSGITASTTNGANSSTITLNSSNTGSSYTLVYRVTDPFAEQSESNITASVVGEATQRLPSVIPVDPRATTINMPANTLGVATNVLMCFEQVANAAGAALSGSPTMSFSESSTQSGVTVGTSGNARTYAGTLANVQAQSSLVRATNSGSAVVPTASKFVKVSVSNTADGSSSCSNGTSRVIELKPLDLDGKRQVQVDID